MRRILSLGAVFTALFCLDGVYADGTAGVHTELLRWCGKPYMPGSPNYDPTGELTSPPQSSVPLLYAEVDPLYNIYVSSEKTGTFIVNVGLSNIHGSPYNGPRFSPFEELHFSIGIKAGKELASGLVTVNTTYNLFDFNLGSLKPQMTPYDIILTATTLDAKQTFTATTELYYLPDKTTGSVCKINNFSGGMLFKNKFTKNQFQPFVAYGFYTSCSGYLELNNSNVQAYKDQGFTCINPVCDIDDGLLEPVLDYMDEIDLPYQYDMRGLYQNLTRVAQHVAAVKDRDVFFSYYTADEPDGASDPLNATKLAYDLIRSIDLYHPVGLVLNCQNYFFEEYTAGADYIMEDAYPIGVNMSWNKWGTNCNVTYGDCGCDNCVGSIEDIPLRLDNFTQYQEWIGGYPKPEWAVLQSFDGEGYWSRLPTVAETWSMNLLAFNHAAKSLMIWEYPTTSDLAAANSQMSKVVTAAPVANFLTNARSTAINVKTHADIDIAYWKVGNQLMIGVASTSYSSINSKVTIELPILFGIFVSQPWGSLKYGVVGNVLEIEGLPPLATSFAILDVF